MKTLALIVVFFFSYGNSTFSDQTILQEQHKFTGSFVGLTDDYYFEFKDENNKRIIFNEIMNEIDVDLFEDEAVGKKFEITWEEFTIDKTDSDGEPTGETLQGKRIIAMKGVGK